MGEIFLKKNILRSNDRLIDYNFNIKNKKAEFVIVFYHYRTIIFNFSLPLFKIKKLLNTKFT